MFRLSSLKESEDDNDVKFRFNKSGLVMIASDISKFIFPDKMERDSLLLLPDVLKTGLFTAQYGNTKNIVTEVDNRMVTYYDGSKMKTKDIGKLSLSNDRDLLKTIFEAKKYKISVEEVQRSLIGKGFDIMVADGKKLAYSGNKNFKKIKGFYLDEGEIFGDFRTNNMIAHLKGTSLFKYVPAGLYKRDEFLNIVAKNPDGKGWNGTFSQINWLSEDNAYRKLLLDTLYALSRMTNSNFMVVDKSTDKNAGEGKKWKEYYVVNEKAHGEKGILKKTNVKRFNKDGVIPFVLESIGVDKSGQINSRKFHTTLERIIKEQFSGIEKEVKSVEQLKAFNNLRSHLILSKTNNYIYYSEDNSTIYYGLLPLSVAISELISEKEWEDKVSAYWEDNHIAYDEYKINQHEKSIFIDKIKNGNGTDDYSYESPAYLNMPFSAETDVKTSIDIEQRVQAGYTEDDIDDIDPEDDFFNERDYKGTLFFKYFREKIFQTDSKTNVAIDDLPSLIVNFMTNLYANIELTKKGDDNYLSGLDTIGQYLKNNDLWKEIDSSKIIWSKNVKSLFEDLKSDKKQQKILSSIYDEYNGSNYDGSFDDYLNEYDLKTTIFTDLFKFFVRSSVSIDESLGNEVVDNELTQKIEDVNKIWNSSNSTTLNNIVDLLAQSDPELDSNLRFYTLRYLLHQSNVNINDAKVKVDLSEIKKGSIARIKLLTSTRESIDGEERNVNTEKSYKNIPLLDYLVLLTNIGETYSSDNMPGVAIPVNTPFNLVVPKEVLYDVIDNVLNFPINLIEDNFISFKNHRDKIMK